MRNSMTQQRGFRKAFKEGAVGLVRTSRRPQRAIAGDWGLSQSFSDRCASCMRGQHGPPFGYGMGFQTAEFLSMVVPKQVRQSATGSQIVRGKTLRQAQNPSRA